MKITSGLWILAAGAMALPPTAAMAGMPKPPVEVAAPPPLAAEVAAVPTQPTLKRKVAIGRFSNATRYGKALLLDNERDPLADQAADMLTARLVDSGKFLVFERGDLGAVEREQATAGASTAKLVGVDALIVGSVTEFGRKVEGKSGFLNSKMKQTANATVEVRLVDVQTGQAFFSTSGHGAASVEVGEVAGFGSAAGYDSTLNDQAISAAISDLTNNVMQKLQGRPWFTDVLQVRAGQVFISGGPGQGMKLGDRYRVETRGETVVSGQTGLPIKLPGQTVGTIEVVSFFGDDPSSQGAVARLVAGQLPPGGDPKALVVVEDRR
jgi:curli biogenesis system outer membrane secretion channel CsgG